MRIIWAYEQQDPGFGGENVFFQYHGANNRGVKSVYLTDAPLLTTFPDDLEEPDPSVKHWDIVFENVRLGHTYSCRELIPILLMVGKKIHYTCVYVVHRIR